MVGIDPDRGIPTRPLVAVVAGVLGVLHYAREETTAREAAQRALEESGVIVLPGASLGKGGEGYFRVALTVDEGRLEAAAGRLGGRA